MSSRKFIVLVFCLLLSPIILAQVTNKEVVAKIKTEKILDLITVKGTVKSKTQIIKSLRYVMYVYKKNLETANVSKGEQVGRIVLQPNDYKELSEITINQNIKDKVTVLLLIYDNDDKLVAKDRLVVLNDDEKGEKIIRQKKIPKENDFVGFRGIVIEETKTKSGRDFYIEFYSNYRLKNINGKEVVKIKEKFSFGRSTIMEVLVGETVVHTFFAQPTRDFIIEQSKYAIKAVSKYFSTLDQEKNFIKQY